jgi:probable F420-dependent oxidoreductase
MALKTPATAEGDGVGTSATAYHDPFVLFGFLSGCTERIGFAAGVLILAQCQAVLVAKQAACLDVLSGGRFRLGVGVGWNEIEFTALNENFANRGKRSEEQVRAMQALWAEPHVNFAGAFHRIEDAGINPRPASGGVPIWFGGHAEATFRRAAEYGDDFMPLGVVPSWCPKQALRRGTKYRRHKRDGPRSHPRGSCCIAAHAATRHGAPDMTLFDPHSLLSWIVVLLVIAAILAAMVIELGAGIAGLAADTLAG